MSKKPTPSQAVMLRDLATRYDHISTTRNRAGKVYEATARSEKGGYMHLAPATFQALIARGWVENKDVVRLDDYLGCPGEQLSGYSLKQAQAWVVERNANTWVLSDSGRAALAGLREEETEDDEDSEDDE